MNTGLQRPAPPLPGAPFMNSTIAMNSTLLNTTFPALNTTVALNGTLLTNNTGNANAVQYQPTTTLVVEPVTVTASADGRVVTMTQQVTTVSTAYIKATVVAPPAVKATAAAPGKWGAGGYGAGAGAGAGGYGSGLSSLFGGFPFGGFGNGAGAGAWRRR